MQHGFMMAKRLYTSVMLRSKPMIWLWLLFLCAAAARVVLALRPGLWVDEVFSLAMATGHSLEHAPEAAHTALGDYVQSPGPLAASVWQHYAEHDSPPASVARVIRAVFLSDSNPPLYYLLLNLWTRTYDTSDAALRLFSTIWALACFPLLWSMANKIGGRQISWITCVLFAFAPVALFYSAEGRMYSLTWFLAAALAWLTLRLHDGGTQITPLFLWVVTAAAALLTHYFLAFVCVACSLWLLLHPGQFRRQYVVAAMAAVGVLISPWYVHLRESLSGWRVSAGWANGSLSASEVVQAPLRLAWSFVSGRGIWGGSRIGDLLLAFLCAGVLVHIIWRADRSPVRPRVQLLWACVMASVFGVLTFDLLMGTTTTLSTPRYVLPGLPAGILLLAFLVARLPRVPRWGVVTLVLLAWLPSVRYVYWTPARPKHPFPELAEKIHHAPIRPDLVIVHSIPSGVIGVSRYLSTNIPVVSSVSPLGQRSMANMPDLVAGHCRVGLVNAHWVSESWDRVAERWLSENAVLEDRLVVVDARWPKVKDQEVKIFRLVGNTDQDCHAGR